MIKTISILLLGFVLLSCTEDIRRIEEPDHLIPRDKMVVFLKDLIKLESHMKGRYVAVPQYHKTMVKSGDSLFKAHGISFEDFDASMDYYGSRQEEMQSIYSEALELLNKELGELQSEK